MKHKDIVERLRLPKRPTHNVANSALRHYSAAGAAILDTKEWLAGIVNHSEDPGNRRLAAHMLERLAEITVPLLGEIEKKCEIPPGGLSEYWR